MTQLLRRFTAEARDLLDGASSGLLALEKRPGDEAIINNVFRSVHTLKGSVGLFDYPAFLKLVHAGEDVLSAIRAGQMNLTSDIVDLLLDSLDYVSAWVDALERSGELPAGADGISKAATEKLRALLPNDYGEQAVAEADVAALSDLGWIKALPAAERLQSARAINQGAVLLAAEYRPREDCFYSGEDPLNLFRQIAPLNAIAIDAVADWAPLAELDAYRCLLRFRFLSCMAQSDVEYVFRYSLETLSIAQITVADLVSLEGRDERTPLHVDFVNDARRFIKARDWKKLGLAAAAVCSLSGPELRIASAATWMQVALAAAEPDARLLAGIVEALETGAPFAPVEQAGGALKPSQKDGTASEVPEQTVAIEPMALSGVAIEILEAQRAILRQEIAEDAIAGQMQAVARTVANVLRSNGAADAAERWLDGAARAPAGTVQTTLARALDDILRCAAAPADPRSAAAPERAAAEAAEVRAEATSGAVVAAESKQAHRVLKVDQAKVDKLMNLIGELVVSKNSLPFLSKRAEEVYGSREMGREIKDLFAVVDRLAQEMQAAIMDVRMLPISEVLDRFPRLVRDVARKLGKQVELKIEGAETAADKNMIEVLGDPLLHIVRNSLDHGIELPADRVAAGKPATATVLISAFQESDEVVIEVSDDGRGIDPERVRAVAISRGVIDQAQAERMSDQDAINLVFAPGFSTAEKVSDLSGRGVGMDVVRSTIEKAGGGVTLNTVKGRGTTLRLSLPLSMAITRVMVVEAAGGNVFGIPMDHIAETVRISRSQVHTVKQSEVFVLREAIVPLLRLDRVLGLERPVWFGDADQEEAVLVVRINGALTGLVVDNFRERMDIILKPFEGLLANIPGYAGTALLGDGHVLLVLNLKELI